MRAIKRWTAGFAMAGLVVLAVVASGHEAAAQGRVSRLADALLSFEQNVTWSSVRREWRDQRDDWVAAVQAASSPREIAEQLLVLESSMRWRSVEEAWRDRRDGWADEMRSARSARAVARGLLELEQATLWSAVDGKWRRLRDPWVEGLESIE